jgi:hypothetical protein
MHISAPSVIWQLKLPKQVTSLASGAALSTFFSVASDHAEKSEIYTACIRVLRCFFVRCKEHDLPSLLQSLTLTSRVYRFIQFIYVFLFSCLCRFTDPAEAIEVRKRPDFATFQLSSLCTQSPLQQLRRGSACIASDSVCNVDGCWYGCIEGLIALIVLFANHRPSTKLHFGELGVILGFKKRFDFNIHLSADLR